MGKAILMSVLVATIWIPMMLATSPQPRRAVRLVQKRFLYFLIGWAIAVVYVVPRL
jgi:hypothetical protein